MEESVDQLYFEEEQRFPLWIEGSRFVLSALILSALALFFLLLAVPNFIIKLVIKLDSSHLYLRIYPLNVPVPFLPPRIKDVSLSDIAYWEVRTYRPLFDREYWGTHFWSLGSAFGGWRYLYMMKVNPISGRGVQLRLRSGERLLIGYKHPEELASAITLAKSQNS